MHIQRSATSIRLYCANKRQGLPCASKSGTLDGYDQQLAATEGSTDKGYTATLTVPV